MKKISFIILLNLFIMTSINLFSSTKRFDNPKIDGIPLDWCLTYATNCGQDAADYFCQYKGYEKAIDFKENSDVGYTKILKTGEICNAYYCDTFKYITCIKKDNCSQDELNQKYNEGFEGGKKYCQENPSACGIQVYPSDCSAEVEKAKEETKEYCKIILLLAVYL